MQKSLRLTQNYLRFKGFCVKAVNPALPLNETDDYRDEVRTGNGSDRVLIRRARYL